MSMNSTIAIPVAPPKSKWLGRWTVSALAVLLLVGATVAFRPWGGGEEGLAPEQLYTVIPTDLEVKIVKDGELQAIRYIDVESKVETPAQIIWLVKEGVTVTKGDELVKLDSSALVQRKEQLDLDLKKAESNLKIAQEMKEIQESQNAAYLETAEVGMQLAQLDLERFKEGTYKQDLANAETALKMANTNLLNKKDELDQTLNLADKGFVTKADVKKAELDVIQAENDVAKAQRALEVLTKYTYAMELARLETAVNQAKARRMRVIRENASVMVQKNADLEEKHNSLEHLQTRATKLQEQIEACTIRAPEDGLVIYMSSIDRWMRDPIQEGTVVRYTQTLMRLPDVRAMKAVLKIQEGQKAKLDVNKNQRAAVRILGVSKRLGATLTKVAVLPDNSLRWMNPDLKEYPIELTLDETPPGLKPGTRVDAEIYLDRLERVLTVPLAAIYTIGYDSYVFVRQGDDIQERKVTIGMTNETMAQVTAGLKENEQVLLLQAGQGRMLLSKAGIKVDEPTTRPSSSSGRRSKRSSGTEASASVK